MISCVPSVFLSLNLSANCVITGFGMVWLLSSLVRMFGMAAQSAAGWPELPNRFVLIMSRSQVYPDIMFVSLFS